MPSTAPLKQRRHTRKMMRTPNPLVVSSMMGADTTVETSSPESISPVALATAMLAVVLTTRETTVETPAPHRKAVRSTEGGSGSQRSIHHTVSSTTSRGMRARITASVRLAPSSAVAEISHSRPASPSAPSAVSTYLAMSPRRRRRMAVGWAHAGPVGAPGRPVGAPARPAGPGRAAEAGGPVGPARPAGPSGSAAGGCCRRGSQAPGPMGCGLLTASPPRTARG